jgi:hypothetical protein
VWCACGHSLGCMLNGTWARNARADLSAGRNCMGNCVWTPFTFVEYALMARLACEIRAALQGQI